ncbi:MAG: hypothetical protein NTY38_13835 [Acidobacteria bacterium]|nr:hypothetical protein [Acidobacteriota bacterium]
MAMAGFSGWWATRWTPAIVSAILFVFSAAVVLFLAFRPAVELLEDSLRIGNRLIPWTSIRRLDRTGWISPLVVHITLADAARILLFYPGDLDSSNSLLRGLRRSSREALIDGVPYGQFWNEPVIPLAEPAPLPAPKYQLLLPEDEADVERMFQRLKTVGHLDPKNSSDES